MIYFGSKISQRAILRCVLCAYSLKYLYVRLLLTAKWHDLWLGREVPNFVWYIFFFQNIQERLCCFSFWNYTFQFQFRFPSCFFIYFKKDLNKEENLLYCIMMKLPLDHEKKWTWVEGKVVFFNIIHISHLSFSA
jgi:hypothetical protein